MDKFYNEDTEFLDDIILNLNDIKFTDLNTSNSNTDDKVSVIITKLVENEYIQYSEQDFKNSLVILFKNHDFNIKLINNLYNIYHKIDNTIITNKFKYNDSNLIPIIFINKKFYTNELSIKTNETFDNIINNENENIIKLELSDYLNKRETIIQDAYDIVQKQLYNLDKPFEDDNNQIKLLDYQNYIPTYDREILTSCIFSNPDDSVEYMNYQCVNINNEPIKLERFRIISPKSITFNKTTIDLHNGDNVKIIGYINKPPSINEEYQIFDLDKYYDGINELEKGDKVNVYFNIKLDKVKIKGEVNSIKDNKINIKLDEKIKIENILTKLLTYDKNSNDNDFYIYPINEENVYYKNLLKENIIAFKFSKKNFEKSALFIFPNIYQLISYYDDIVNYNNIKKILTDNHYNINNLDDNDINLIHSILEKNVTLIENKPEDELKNKIFNLKELKPDKFSLLNLKDLPDHYLKYYNLIEDTEDNRYKFITMHNDLGYIHFLNKLKLQIIEDYKEVKDNDFKEELKKLKVELLGIEEKLERFKENDCNQIQIDKFYYDVSQFENEKDTKKYEDKYVVLIDNNISTLYLMDRGNWKKIRIIDDKNEVKICDGKYYFEEIKENRCAYDDINKLCEKRDVINLKRKLEIIQNQINFTKDLKKFKSKYEDYVKSIDNTIEKNKSIVNNEFKYKQVSYKKKIIQNKYIGNEDYVDFSEQFENIDTNNLETFNPLNSTTEIHNPYKDEINFLFIEKILINIGFELNLNEKLYIYESVDFLTNESFKKKIQSLKKQKPKLSNQTLIKEFAYEKERMNLLVIAGLIIIIIQIQFPNVEFKKIYNKCSDNFNIDGYPRNKDEGEKQLYKYVLCVISESNDFNYNFNSKDNKYKLKDVWLKNTITFILQRKDFLKNTLENKTDINETQIPNVNQIWTGFKPELNIKNKPTNLISKYLYDIHNVVNKSKILNFNVFKKPLKSNICCLEKVNQDINYYNLIKNNIDYNDYNSKFKSDTINKLIVNEIFINIIKRKLYANFDNKNIFTKENIITFRNAKSYKLNKPQLNYFDFTEKITKILNNQSNIQIKNDENLKNIIENLDKNNSWNNFSTKIEELFDDIITFTENNSSQSLTSEIKNDLKDYFITLSDLDEEDDLNYLKRILQKFINSKISSIIHKIKNYKVINKIDIKKTKFLENKDIYEIDIAKNKDRVNIFIEQIQHLSTFKNFNFDIILENINCSTIDINLPNNNKNADIDNLTKNIYILSYIFLNIILYIYSSLLYDKPQSFDKDILNKIGDLPNIDTFDNIIIIADIVSFILTEFRDTIKNNLIHKEKLQSKMDKLREERKNMKLNIFEKLDVDEADTMKLLKDIVGIEYDYEKENTRTEFTPDVNTEINIQELTNQEEENENYTNYRTDYLGENADEIEVN